MAKAKKKAAKRGGIVSYIRKIENSPRVKSANKKIKSLEAKLKQEKRKKEKAKKEAQRKYRKMNK